MKSKREQILKLCEFDENYYWVNSDTQYYAGALFENRRLQSIILALIETLEKHEAHFNEIKNYDPSGDGDSPYEVSCKALTANPIDELLAGEK